MNKWKTRELTRVCLFGALLALLMGCNNDSGVAPATPPVANQNTPTGTFVAGDQVIHEGNVIDDIKVPDEPVVGVVTAVPDTEPKPVISNPSPWEQTIITQGEVKTYVEPAKRFIEVAPDTTGGAIYHSSPPLEYDLGNLVTMNTADSIAFTDGRALVTPVKGRLFYPESPLNASTATERFPIIIFMHGMHSWSDPSYKGYDYLARDLAEHGYVVASIDANVINSTRFDNASGLSRAQLVLGMLDRLRQIDGFGQVDLGGNRGKLDPLRGSLDFARIGLMGHSRGGQGIVNAILFNETRRGVTEGELKERLKHLPTPLEALRKIFSSSSDATLQSLISAAPKGLSTLKREFGVDDATAKIIVETVMDPSGLKIPYPDLINAIIPASGTKPIGIDNATFQAAISKYNIFYAAGSENTNGNDAAYYTFKGAFLVGPTDFGGNSGLSNVPLAVLLPSCDGDMANLQGASTYDRNRFGRTGDVAPRYQVMVNGANHNDYNTIWTNEDFTFNTEAKTWRGPQHCNRDVKQKDNIRLSREDQRRTGLFVINSFMRYHVGDEKKFQSWWSGAAQLPNETCPSGKGPCDERIVLTVQRAANDRLRIQNFEWADSLRLNLIGGAVSFSGFDEKARCILPSVADVGGNCTLKRLSGFEYSGWGGKGLLSIADHVELAWSKPKEEAGKQPVQAERAIISDLKDLSAKDYDSLTFRIAVVRPMGQEVLVTLTDTAGKSATVTASNFTNALYNAPRRKTYPVKTVPVANASIGLPDPAKANSTMVDLIGQQAPFESPPAVTLVAPPEPDPARDIPLLDHTADAPYANGEVKMLLNMVAIPLQAFEGIDLAHLDKLKLAFPKESGKVAITDIELQNFGRAERLAEIALEQAGIVSGSGAGIALNGNGGPPKSASGKPEDKQLILNH